MGYSNDINDNAAFIIGDGENLLGGSNIFEVIRPTEETDYSALIALGNMESLWVVPCEEFDGGDGNTYNEVYFSSSNYFYFSKDSSTDSKIHSENIVSEDGTTLLTMPTIYTKADGFVDMINFMITSSERTTATDMNRTTARHYPLLPSSNYQTTLIDIKGDRMGGVPYYKRPNEILHLNYEIAFLPYLNDEIYVCRAFIEDNELFNLDQVKENKNIYAHLSTHKQYSINDMKIDVESEGMGILVNVNYEIDTDDNRNAVLTFDLGAEMLFDSWAITDEEGNILICANDKRPKQHPARQYINIYFYGNGTRI